MYKCTAIYDDRWMSGSHMQSITRAARLDLEQKTKEALVAALEDQGVSLESVVFLFDGHPEDADIDV